MRVRFVVDLLSGSSAGGLNGVCLASALANDRPGSNTRLERLEELWVKHGDLDTLFAGPYIAICGFFGVTPPRRRTELDRSTDPELDDPGGL